MKQLPGGVGHRVGSMPHLLLQAKDMFIPNPAGEPPQTDSNVDLLGWGAGGGHEAALLDQQPEDAYNPTLRVSPPDIPDQP